MLEGFLDQIIEVLRYSLVVLISTDMARCRIGIEDD